MDRKKLFDHLFTALHIAEAVNNSNGHPVNADVALTAFFSHRFSDAEGYKSRLDYLMYLSREFIPELGRRGEATFYSGRNLLQGYRYYAKGTSKGLVVFVHGIMGCADDKYAIFQAEMLRRGYDVFAFDLTASGRSQGQEISGLQQSAYDVAAALDYLRSTGECPLGMPVFLFGHSWGGYGVAASLGLGARPTAVVSVSGFASPLKEMLGLPSSYFGGAVPLGEGELSEALRRRVGEHYDLSAYEGVRGSGVPTLLIHGDQDKTVPLEGVSLLHEAQGLPNVETILRQGYGHMDVFFDPRAVDYAKKVKEMGEELIARYGKSLESVPKEEIEGFERCFNRRLCSALDQGLFDSIDAFLSRHIV